MWFNRTNVVIASMRPHPSEAFPIVFSLMLLKTVGLYKPDNKCTSDIKSTNSSTFDQNHKIYSINKNKILKKVNFWKKKLISQPLKRLWSCIASRLCRHTLTEKYLLGALKISDVKGLPFPNFCRLPPPCCLQRSGIGCRF